MCFCVFVCLFFVDCEYECGSEYVFVWVSVFDVRGCVYGLLLVSMCCGTYFIFNRDALAVMYAMLRRGCLKH